MISDSAKEAIYNAAYKLAPRVITKMEFRVWSWGAKTNQILVGADSVALMIPGKNGCTETGQVDWPLTIDEFSDLVGRIAVGKACSWKRKGGQLVSDPVRFLKDELQIYGPILDGPLVWNAKESRFVCYKKYETEEGKWAMARHTFGDFAPTIANPCMTPHWPRICDIAKVLIDG
jgi:hypothetical protein